MARYVYVGWGPEVGPDGEFARPFDEREFEEQPTWGRWALLSEPGAVPPPPVTPPASKPVTGTEGGM